MTFKLYLWLINSFDRFKDELKGRTGKHMSVHTFRRIDISGLFLTCTLVDQNQTSQHFHTPLPDHHLLLWLLSEK